MGSHCWETGHSVVHGALIGVDDCTRHNMAGRRVAAVLFGTTRMYPSPGEKDVSTILVDRPRWY